jgi:hypothetical protein
MKKTLGTNADGFFDFSKEVNEFVRGDIPENINNANIQEYKQDLLKLQEQVGVMNEYLSEISSIAKGENDPNTPLDEMNIQASQQIQDYRIKKLHEDIAQTTDLIKKAKLRDDAKSFKKIPIYSSCVVSNADGSYSTDTPTGSSTGTNNISTNGTVNSSGTVTGAVSGDRLQSAVANVYNKSGTSVQQNDSLGLGDLLGHIQDKGLTINLNARN